MSAIARPDDGEDATYLGNKKKPPSRSWRDGGERKRKTYAFQILSRRAAGVAQMTPTPDLDQARAFLSTLFADKPADHWLYTWTPKKTPSGRPTSKWSTSIATVAKNAWTAARTQNVYFGVATARANLGAGSRVENHTAAGIPAIWCEIDMSIGEHKNTNLPPDEDAARRLLADFLTPSLIVHSGGGWHVYWIFKEFWVFDTDAERAEAADLVRRVQATIRAKLEANRWGLDPTHDLARVLRVAGTINRKNPQELRPVRIISQDDTLRYNPSDFEDYLTDDTVGASPTATVSDVSGLPVGKAAFEFVAVGAPTKHQRPRALGAARSFLSAGYAVDRTIDLIWKGMQACEQNRSDPWTREHAEQIVNSIAAKPAPPLRPIAGSRIDIDPVAVEAAREVVDEETERKTPEPTRNEDRTAVVSGGDEHLTDLGNARRLIRLYGNNLRYVSSWNLWFVWDGTRWCEDITGAAVRYAKRVSRSILGEASAIENDTDRRTTAKWAFSSESHARITAMLALGQTEAGVSISHTELDSDPWLLNLANGTIELRTGTFRAHRRADLLNQKAGTHYDPSATCPTWDKFLDDVFQSNTSLIEFVRRMVGYSLTGDVSEQVLFFLDGDGSNGKSTLIGTVLALLGDYGWQATSSLLVTKKGDGDHPTELAHLFKKRFVATIEIDDGKRMAESLVKQLTGGDLITARRMRENPWSFTATHKLAQAANHKLTIQGTDHAIWRRVRVIPFKVKFEKPDKTLGARLRNELPGILNWALAGCLEWQRKGLDEPKAVLDATAEYRAEQDVLAQFLADCCVTHRNAKVAAKRLFGAYATWCVENGEKVETQRALSKRLSGLGCEKSRGTGGVRMWLGIGLRAASELVNVPQVVDETAPAQGDDGISDTSDASDAELPMNEDHFSHEGEIGKITSLASLTSLPNSNGKNHQNGHSGRKTDVNPSGSPAWGCPDCDERRWLERPGGWTCTQCGANWGLTRSVGDRVYPVNAEGQSLTVDALRITDIADRDGVRWCAFEGTDTRVPQEKCKPAADEVEVTT